MKTVLVLSVLVIITTPYCYSAAIEDAATDTNIAGAAAVATEETSVLDIDIETQKVNIIRQGIQGERGPQGEQGPQGPQGEQGPSRGGAVYTRWGRTDCPNTDGTELVYKGLVAGSNYNNYGGGANFLCLTEDVKYLSTTSTSGANSPIYGAYQASDVAAVSTNIPPCAICLNNQRGFKLMIPGTTSCPTSWTEEYEGYLMSEYYSYANNKKFECFDKDGESGVYSGSQAYIYNVGVQCGYGLPCPPFVDNTPITCVVCTK